MRPCTQDFCLCKKVDSLVVSAHSEETDGGPQSAGAVSEDVLDSLLTVTVVARGAVSSDSE